MNRVTYFALPCESIRIQKTNYFECKKFVGGSKISRDFISGEHAIIVSTTKGDFIGRIGDWIVREPDGNFVVRSDENYRKIVHDEYAGK